MTRWSLFLASLLLLATPSARAEGVVKLHAAGSLRAAFTELAQSFTAATGIGVETNFGASGLLREALAHEASGDVFASADLGNPRALAEMGKAGPVILFARNRLCAETRPGFAATSETLLERMLDPATRLATSTPKNDPAGDYAWEVFRKAESIKAGARAALEAKALPLSGAKDSPRAPDGKGVYAWNLEEKRADLFLLYCTNAHQVSRDLPGAATIELPPALATGAQYGITALKPGDSAKALALISYILSPEGQAILAKHGFDAPLFVAADSR
ncbi:MAG TPA: molybdate ABC transporter substrate-binding protein [Stellaceae bacterium]|nr:molybdate ABC transporter substrate-binding protein [Stellaceae bacterium]